jgi:hypothetical protein
MPKSAMPEWIKDQAEGTGTDWDNPIQKHFHKSWFAFGPRATEWWARWREFPITLLGLFGSGFVRFETETWERDSSADMTVSSDTRWYVINGRFGNDYLSRVQYYLRWHVQVQWPLMVAAHFYTSAKDVPVPGQPRPDTDGKLWFFYVGAHRDPDKVFWFPSGYLGRNWK